MKKGFLILFCLAVMGIAKAQQQGNHWTPVGLEHNMTVSGIILIDGNEQMVSTLEVGAFCGEQCRGSRRGQYFSMTGQYVVPLQIQGNANGEVITFRLYDHATQQELNLESVNTLEFEINGRIGAPGNWYPFSFNSPAQSFTLSITGYGNSNGGYYLIAPPVDDVDPATVAGMTTGDYDLYYFDQGETDEWRNYEAEPFNLFSGKGYLYAHRTDVTLNFTGTSYSGDGVVTLSKTAGVPLTGWNLVGNPFVQTATIDRDCYVMNAAGTEIIAGNTRTVNPMQGVFVIAAEDEETMTFSPGNSVDEGSRIVIEVLQGRGASTSSATVDRAIVRFGEGSTLPKFMLNPSNTKLYIPTEDADYAVVRVNGENEMPVNFKAAEDGVYTLKVDKEHVEMGYLHLVDNMTGDDIDLLHNPSYSFEAHTTDYADRFKLVFAYTSVCEDTDGDKAPFAYVDNGNIVVNGDGTLQVIDAMGHVVVTADGRTRYVPTAGMASGVYVLRLINGDETRVQKIVIK